ncbi:hypothetical protein RFI_20305 [Reticulomyxa filosa]|uniref:Uncharacterized protein n=1 Tax=Reticulomyxa filosa TaxID=46433 RepID=X6MUB0_RETFI|nr:hypothetical protein RFI_20305 [Reticulomyxa filosa]|eukprot:ETO17032.1 hypothetical protein RFI_20305 [Reticulomyxa filosa]
MFIFLFIFFVMGVGVTILCLQIIRSFYATKKKRWRDKHTLLETIKACIGSIQYCEKTLLSLIDLLWNLTLKYNKKRGHIPLYRLQIIMFNFTFLELFSKVFNVDYTSVFVWSTFFSNGVVILESWIYIDSIFSFSAAVTLLQRSTLVNKLSDGVTCCRILFCYVVRRAKTIFVMSKRTFSKKGKIFSLLQKNHYARKSCFAKKYQNIQKIATFTFFKINIYEL